MKKVYINGIGIVLPIAQKATDLWDEINKPILKERERCSEIPAFLPSRVMRRMDRLSALALYSAGNALEDAGMPIQDTHDVGSVFNTTFGPVNTNLKFGEFVVNGDPNVASPAIFANTVNNACLGHVCMNLRIKGASTMLLCSNYIGYGMKLIRDGKVRSIVAAGVEEHTEKLFDLFEKKNYPISECAAALVLSEQKNEASYCEISAYHEENLGGHSIFSETFSIDSDDIKRIVDNALEKAEISSEKIDGIITACHNPYEDSSECAAIREIFGDTLPVIHPKSVLGDTLGAALGINIALGALALKNQNMPRMLFKESDNTVKEFKHLLINSYDISGDFTSFILKKE
ncbi:MAG: beta-ketoacyl synthase N-terminal-like domain-containing protein [Clostridia bacterium]